MTRKMPDFHELWKTTIYCDKTKRSHLEEVHNRLEGRGLYESYDAEKRLIRCGICPQIIRGVVAITAWDNEVNWIIRIPFNMYDDKEMRIYKQTLKRHHHPKIKTKDKK
jgi:hypothetical protein